MLREQIMKFGKGNWKNFQQGCEREWLITNGIGGYASSTIIGANTRRQHGLLTASLHPPVQRVLIWSKVEEILNLGKAQYSFGSNERPGWVEEGQKHLQRFSYENLPLYNYQVEDVWLDKKIALVYGHNTAVVGYEVKNGGRPLKLTLKPLLNFRTHEESSTRYDLEFAEAFTEQQMSLTPLKNQDVQIQLYCEKGRVKREEKHYYEHLGKRLCAQNVYDEYMQYAWEITDGKPPLDTHYVPAVFEVEFAPYEASRFAIICTLEELPAPKGWELIAQADQRQDNLANHVGISEPLVRSLVKAADQFIVQRQSTAMKTVLAGYPWFADWGRDTMIAFHGLTLVTKRFADAKEILWTFAKYIKNGLVPNMFPDEGSAPLYNTVDASLWYFYAVDQYLRYTKDYAFIQQEIYPKLKEIITYYQNGTDFSIGMANDGLIKAGSGTDQVTWMDVRIGDYVVTPRHGKPVEINALWYNALRVMAELAQRFNEDSAPYQTLAEQVKISFNEKFWNEASGGLFDWISEETSNTQIRPNQIFAVSLPYTMLSRDKEQKIVEQVMQKLYATYGLRSLAQDDAEYKGVYQGKLWNRDCAYHQGTTWSFLLGGLITAYCKIHNNDAASLAQAKKMLEAIEDHLQDSCLGSIAEIFDGDEPILARGCFAQAWGVGEILRSYVEDVLQIKPSL